MQSGKIIRLNRIFREDKRAVCFAADHGLMHGPTEEVTKLEEIIEKVIEAGIDAILLSSGRIKKLCNTFLTKYQPALLIRGDWISGARMAGVGKFLPTYELKRTEIINPKDALKMGACAITIYLMIGYSDDYEALNYKSCVDYAQECRRIGLPLIIEPLPIPIGQTLDNLFSPSFYEYGARVAKEIGADVLKVPYTFDKESFKEVVKSASIPTLILGGEKIEDEEEIFRIVKEALECGAKGIVFGRQILESKEPYKITKKLVALIHDKTV